MGRQKTQEEFIRDSVEVHGVGKFDYSRVDYKNSKIHVEIGCTSCGEWFPQKPNHNLNGRGCPKCANQKRGPERWTKDRFVEKAVSVHGDKYDYSNVVYRQYDQHVAITCKTHNSTFLQTPHMHIAGNGCPTCAEGRKGKSRQSKAAKNFIKDAELTHGDLYDYSRVVYTLSTEFVEIGCKRCGDFFLQTPSGHKQGYGCTACAYADSGLKKRSSTAKFIEKSREVHGVGRFLYDRVRYTTANHKVTIGCVSCGGYWDITPNRHFRGNGCASCADYGFKPDQPATLYVLKYKNIVKVGITNRETGVRIKEINKDSGYRFREIHSLEFDNGRECADLEAKLLEYLRGNYVNPESKYNGSTESFLDVDIGKLLGEIEIGKKE